MTTEPLIVTVLQHYFPDWEQPRTRGDRVSCLCPFHGDTRPSASVDYKNNRFKCFSGCEGGSAYDIIMREEGISYPEALRFAEELSPGSNAAIQQQSARKSSRRTFGQQEPDGQGRGVEPHGSVPSGIRGRSTPWS